MKVKHVAWWVAAAVAVLTLLGMTSVEANGQPREPGKPAPRADLIAQDEPWTNVYFPLALGASPYRLYGIGFSPYMDGQSPGMRTRISESQLRARMSLIAPHTQWIRAFGMTDGLEKSGKVAHELGLKAALGAWFDRRMTAAQKDEQVSNLIDAANAGEADMVILGSEALYRGDLSEAELLGYIQQVKAAIPTGIPVTTAEIFDVLIQHPAVIEAIDVAAVNMYPYWLGLPLEDALAAQDDWLRRVQDAVGAKQVILSEAGWPSCGERINAAIPNGQNASRYFLNFISWARARGVPYFYFEAFDERWKAAAEGPQGACWGVWNKNGVLKPGMEKVFAWQSLPDNWSGEPAIHFLSVPALGSFANLEGYTLHANPADYGVVVYIKVNGGWWVKPTNETPVSAIRANGLWTCDITTGGSDQLASEIAAYLIPVSITPPVLLGAPTLPAELAAYPHVQVTREP